MVVDNQTIAKVLRHIAMAAAGIAEMFDPTPQNKRKA